MLQHHRDPPLDHAVMRRRMDGCVLAADAMMDEQLHEVRLLVGYIRAVARAKALHDRRYSCCVDFGQETSEDLRDVGLPLQTIRPPQSRLAVGNHHQVSPQRQQM